MSKKTGTLAALLLMTSALASTAEAGGGVRLSFGGPLGSFVAHPTLSSGPGGTARSSRHCDKPSVARSYSKPKSSYSVARSEPAPRKAHKAKVEVAEAPVHKTPRKVHKAPQVEVAEAPVHKTPRKPKVYIERNVSKPAVQTAKLEDTSVASDAAPSITIPESPVAPVLTGTQSTPAAQGAATSTPSTTTPAPTTPPATATTQTAALEQAPVTVQAVAPDAELKATTATTEPAPQPVVTPAVAATPTTAAPASDTVAATEPAKSEPAVSETKPAKTSKAGKAKAESMANRICKRFSAAIAGLIDVPCE